MNKTVIALNILYVPYNTEEIRLTYKSKHNFKWGKPVILLMITDGKAQKRGQKWHYIAVKSLSAFLRGITLIIYCLNCFH